jgi:hypothetical protein
MEHLNLKTMEHLNLLTMEHLNLKTMEHLNLKTMEHLNLLTMDHHKSMNSLGSPINDQQYTIKKKQQNPTMTMLIDKCESLLLGT